MSRKSVKPSPKKAPQKSAHKSAPKRTEFVACIENIAPCFIAFEKVRGKLILTDSFQSLADARAFSDTGAYIFTLGPKGVTFVEQITEPDQGDDLDNDSDIQ